MRKKLPPKRDSEENRSRAFNWSLKYLSYRDRSVKEVYDYLVRKNFAQDTINAILKKLVDLKFLNDEEFARQWIESRQKHKGKSKFILKNELRLKGLNDDVIEPLLKKAQDDLETAQILFEKKKRILGNLPKEEFKKKISGFLQRKGFSFDIINKLFRRD
ncbi:MAG: regulatory protein RecX [Candidatus Levybacteria bacterium]|nr:regulatory protein RecX [Candidatus Levybacteria bacterium]